MAFTDYFENYANYGAQVKTSYTNVVENEMKKTSKKTWLIKNIIIIDKNSKNASLKDPNLGIKFFAKFMVYF